MTCWVFCQILLCIEVVHFMLKAKFTKMSQFESSTDLLLHLLKRIVNKKCLAQLFLLHSCTCKITSSISSKHAKKYFYVPQPRHLLIHRFQKLLEVAEGKPEIRKTNSISENSGHKAERCTTISYESVQWFRQRIKVVSLSIF